METGVPPTELRCLEDELFCTRLELATLSGLVLRNQLERWVPGFVPANLEVEHINRYHWVAERVAGKRVLDIACGAGRGSAILAEAGAVSVTGVDLDPEIVRYASVRNAAPGVEFVCADVRDFSSVPFDTVVSFETVEHVPRVEEYFASIAKCLASDGEFVVSTPISDVEHDMKPTNPFHVQEWGLRAFNSSVGKQFRVVETQLQLSKEPRNYARRVLNTLGLGRCTFEPYVVRPTTEVEPLGWPGVKYRGYQILICRHL